MKKETILINLLNKAILLLVILTITLSIYHIRVESDGYQNYNDIEVAGLCVADVGVCTTNHNS